MQTGSTAVGQARRVAGRGAGHVSGSRRAPAAGKGGARWRLSLAPAILFISVHSISPAAERCKAASCAVQRRAPCPTRPYNVVAGIDVHRDALAEPDGHCAAAAAAAAGRAIRGGCSRCRCLCRPLPGQVKGGHGLCCGVGLLAEHLPAIIRI